MSDPSGNTERRVVAKFIVATALGEADDVRNTWQVFDLRTPQRIRLYWLEKPYALKSRWVRLRRDRKCDHTRNPGKGGVINGKGVRRLRTGYLHPFLLIYRSLWPTARTISSMGYSPASKIG